MQYVRLFYCLSGEHLIFVLGETPKWALLQIVKAQMKCSIMLHFIRVYIVWKGKKDNQTKEYNIFWKLKPDTPRYVQWTIPSLLYQTRRKNPLVYKGSKHWSDAYINSLKNGFSWHGSS